MQLPPLFAFEAEGRKVLGLDTGLSPADFAKTRGMLYLSDKGYVVASDLSVQAWRPDGVVEREGSMVVWGPLFEGTLLTQVLVQGDEAAWRALRSYVGSRLALQKAYPDLDLPVAGLTLIGSDGSLFFPPRRLALRGLDSAPAPLRAHSEGAFIHPDLHGEEAESFATAALASFALGMALPFGGDTLDSIWRRMRERDLPPARMAFPGLDVELARMLDAALLFVPGKPDVNEAPSRRPSLEQWSTLLSAKQDIKTLRRELSSAEVTLLRRESERERRRRSGRIFRRRFLDRYSTPLLVSLVVLVSLGLLGRSIYESARSKPTTQGLSPTEVVQTYYRAFDGIDFELMQACVRNGAGKKDIEGAANLVAILRMLGANNPNVTYLSVDEWLADGRPSTSRMIFGVQDDISIKAAGGSSSSEPRYKVLYTVWEPATQRLQADSPDRQQRPISMPIPIRREDTLTLKQSKGLWHIISIERIEQRGANQP